MTGGNNPRWEIVQTDAGWHARFVASNGKVIVSSQVYARQIDARKAIRLVTSFLPYNVQGDWFVTTPRGVREIRDIDERTAS